VALHPEGREGDPAPFVVAESTRPGHEGERGEIRYDFLVNATGPKLNFGATEGLGPGRHSLSVCTASHAGETARALDEAVTPKVFQPNGFTKVDADYTAKPYEEWSARDWPSTYESPAYSNVFAAGIAFAPPHAISRPRQTPSGAPVAPAPPRTGMPSAMIGKASPAASSTCSAGRRGPPGGPRWPGWAPPAWLPRGRTRSPGPPSP
jgi:hypothetical protein